MTSNKTLLYLLKKKLFLFFLKQEICYWSFIFVVKPFFNFISFSKWWHILFDQLLNDPLNLGSKFWMEFYFFSKHIRFPLEKKKKKKCISGKKWMGICCHWFNFNWWNSFHLIDGYFFSLCRIKHFSFLWRKNLKTFW